MTTIWQDYAITILSVIIPCILIVPIPSYRRIVKTHTRGILPEMKSIHATQSTSLDFIRCQARFDAHDISLTAL